MALKSERPRVALHPCTVHEERPAQLGVNDAQWIRTLLHFTSRTQAQRLPEYTISRLVVDVCLKLALHRAKAGELADEVSVGCEQHGVAGALAAHTSHFSQAVAVST